MSKTYKRLLSSAAYLPKLPWRQGEREAFKTAIPAINAITIPIFLVPPAGDFDHEIGHIPTPAEHILLFGPRLFECRRKRPVFIDALWLDDERHRIDPSVHPLTALLERARLAGAQAWPMTSLERSSAYQAAVANAHRRHGFPVAIQVSLSDMDAPNLSDKLSALCNQISCSPTNAVLFLDYGSVFVLDEAEFAALLIRKMNELPSLYEWNQIVFAATSLSDPQKIKVGEQKIIRRHEWQIYQSMLAARDEMYRLPLYSDYGVEFRRDMRPMKARPSAKLNYTTEASHQYVKGENVKTGGYQAIYPVADVIASSASFKGADFSQGDARIASLHERKARTGSAPTWKWIAVDHHLAMVCRQIATAMGFVLEVPAPSSSSPTQLDLFLNR